MTILLLLAACLTTPPTSPVETPAPEPAGGGSAEPVALLRRATTATKTDTGPCACSANGDVDRYCAGVLATQGKTAQVKCLRAEEADGDADRLTSGCLASLDAAQALNDAVVLDCQPYKRAYCAGIGPSLGAEPLFDCYRSHTGEITAAGGAKCIADLAAHQASQDATQACGRG